MNFHKNRKNRDFLKLGNKNRKKSLLVIFLIYYSWSNFAATPFPYRRYSGWERCNSNNKMQWCAYIVHGSVCGLWDWVRFIHTQYINVHVHVHLLLKVKCTVYCVYNVRVSWQYICSRENLCTKFNHIHVDLPLRKAIIVVMNFRKSRV